MSRPCGQCCRRSSPRRRSRPRLIKLPPDQDVSARRSLADLVVRAAVDADEAAAVTLWRKCGLVVSHNDPNDDFRSALAGATSTVLLAQACGSIVGTVMVGHDGHRGWIYYLASDPEWRRHGIGRVLVDAAKTWLRDLGVRKVQLLVRRSNVDVLDFYRRIGFEQSDVVMMQQWLEMP